jgi:hypothetical protein
MQIREGGSVAEAGCLQLAQAMLHVVFLAIPPLLELAQVRDADWFDGQHQPGAEINLGRSVTKR